MATVKDLYKITALTNLHVGSGDQNYGIVDKLVQRDPLSRLPVIHASSLKGALKIYCREVLGMTEANNPPFRNSFGSEHNQGNDKYFSAHLLTIPIRSNVKPYFRATCPSILNEIYDLMLSFNFLATDNFLLAIKKLKDACNRWDKKFLVFNDLPVNAIIEEYAFAGEFDNKTEVFADNKIRDDLGYKKEDLVIVRDDVFMEICENLPVVARNRMDKHKNLWYEELVPRQSEFCFFYVGAKENRVAILDEIVKISSQGMPVQIGANATVGYGFCKIEKSAGHEAR